MYELDTTSKTSNQSPTRGRGLPILAIVLGIAVLVVLVNENIQQTAREQRLNEKLGAIQATLKQQADDQKAIEPRLNEKFSTTETDINNQTAAQQAAMEQHFAAIQATLKQQADDQKAIEPRLNEKFSTIETDINNQTAAQQAAMEQHFAAIQATLKQQADDQKAIEPRLNEKFSTIETDINNQTAAQQAAMEQHFAAIQATLKQQADDQKAIEPRLNEKFSTIETDINNQTAAQQAAMEQHFAAMQATLKQQADDQKAAIVQSLNEKLATVETAINNQTAVLDRAMGKVIPIILPPGLTEQMAQLEKVLDDQSLWPRNPTDADKLQNQLSDVVHQIPPWAEDDAALLPRLTKLRWGFGSLALLSQTGTIDGKSAGDLADKISDLLEAAPDGANETLQQKLQSEQTALNDKYNDYRKTSVIETADTALSGKSADVQTLGSAWSSLDEWKGDAKIDGLRSQLRSRQIDLQIAAWNSALSKVEIEKDDSFRQTTMAALLMTATDQRVALLDDAGISDETKRAVTDFCASLQNKLKEMSQDTEKTMADGQQKLLLNYQKWALAQIKHYEADLASAKIALPGKLYGKNPDYGLVRDAMVNWLVSISPNYLDQSVLSLYNDDWSEGWKLLENQKDLQTNVAEQEYVLKKTTPTDLP